MYNIYIYNIKYVIYIYIYMYNIIYLLYIYLLYIYWANPYPRPRAEHIPLFGTSSHQGAKH